MKNVNCLEWHDKCGARCCRFFMISFGSEEIAEAVMKQPSFSFARVGKVRTEDFAWYLRLHDVTVHRDLCKIDMSEYKVERRGDRLIFWRDCELLRGNLCGGHPHNKPEHCKIGGGEFDEPYIVLGDECGYNQK